MFLLSETQEYVILLSRLAKVLPLYAKSIVEASVLKHNLCPYLLTTSGYILPYEFASGTWAMPQFLPSAIRALPELLHLFCFSRIGALPEFFCMPYAPKNWGNAPVL